MRNGKEELKYYNLISFYHLPSHLIDLTNWMLKIMADPINILTRDKTHMRERANKKMKKKRDLKYITRRR